MSGISVPSGLFLTFSSHTSLRFILRDWKIGINTALNPPVTLKCHNNERATTLRQPLEKGYISVAPLREPELILVASLTYIFLEPMPLRSLYYELECLYYNLTPPIGYVLGVSSKVREELGPGLLETSI